MGVSGLITNFDFLIMEFFNRSIAFFSDKYSFKYSFKREATILPKTNQMDQLPKHVKFYCNK